MSLVVDNKITSFLLRWPHQLLHFTIRYIMIYLKLHLDCNAFSPYHGYEENDQ